MDIMEDNVMAEFCFNIHFFPWGLPFNSHTDETKFHQSLKANVEHLDEIGEMNFKFIGDPVELEVHVFQVILIYTPRNQFVFN